MVRAKTEVQYVLVEDVVVELSAVALAAVELKLMI